MRQTSPLIDCTGPDGKHFRTTQKECNDFNAAWGDNNQAATSSKPTTGTSSNTQSLTPEDVRNMIISEQIRQSIREANNDRKVADSLKCLEQVQADTVRCYKDCESKGTYWDDVVCEYAYGANGVVSKSDLNLYSQCLEQQGKAYLDCKKECNSKYDFFTICPKVNF